MTEETQAAETAVESTGSVSLDTIYGVKAGMTRIFDEAGNHVPVTVIKLIPNHITQVKTLDKDGYEAYQLGYYEKREKLVKKATKGHLSKASVDNNYVRFAEVRTESADTANLGKELAVGFEANSYVDVTGTTKGKGFQGQMKRHNFAGGPASHGSKFHRRGGSIGNRATPGKVWKNKRMPGHMGAKQQTTQNIMVVEVNTEKGYMLLKGSVPGSKNGFVKVAKALKK
ncbi:50S ribosomal protein L3 [Bacteriovorax sp. DB6_IX]|uniref:50S ribosomal protein L3 n=1 Tax=Bacteriovorax sp. DB6_IX TaxID=1353530 RepID=UPI00038A2B8C|nr:50S ribosomal protein L3 [Bacteriovorax sp. DB6_IX]EQC52754.1 50S ribosomal protein L3 [Bacteriovorax sp. DB6_IX]